MNQFKRIFQLTLITCMAAVCGLHAQDVVYVVGNISNWKEPSDRNSDFYKDFMMHEAGVLNGVTIWQAEFDVSDLTEAPMFRFYTALNGWESDSLGSQESDMPVEYSLSSLEVGVPVVSGKGSFNLAGWKGQHIYITLFGNIMTASPNGYEMPKSMYVFLKNSLNTYYLTPCPNNPGCYYVRLPIAYEQYDPDYLENGIFVIPGSFVGQPGKDVYINAAQSLIADEYGIAQSSFTITDTMTGVDFSNTTNYQANPYIYIDFNNNKIYLNRSTSRWAWVSNTVAPNINFDNYKQFDDCWVKVGFHSIVKDMPSTDTFSIYYMTPTLLPVHFYRTDNWDVTKEETKYILNNYPLPTFETSVICRNWPGGKLVISADEVGYIKSMDEMYVRYWDWNNNITQFVPLVKSADNPDVFEAVVDFVAVNDDSQKNDFDICFSKGTKSSSYYHESIPGLAITVSGSFLFTGENDTQSKSFIVYPYGINFPLDQFQNGGKLQFKVNMADHTMYLTPLSEVDNMPIIKQIYSKDGEVANYQSIMFLLGSVNNQRVYGATVLQSDINGSFSYLNSFSFSSGENLIFDFDNPFKVENGIKYYNYTLSKTDQPTLFEIPGAPYPTPTYLIANLIPDEKVLEIYDSKSSFSDYKYKDDILAPEFFYISARKYDDGYKDLFDESKDYCGLEKYLHFPVLPMVKADPVKQEYVYEGVFKLPATTDIELQFGIIPECDNLCFPYYGLSTVNRYPDWSNSEFTTNGNITTWPNYLYLKSTVNNESDEYAARIKINGDGIVELWIGNGEAGRNGADMVETQDSFKVSSARGGVIIESSLNRHVDIYSISGMLIRSLEVEAGMTSIQGLQPGVYIVNNTKLVVR